MKAVLVSMLMLCAISTLLISVTAPAATHTPSSTLVLQCGDSQRAESAPAISTPQPETAATSSAAAPKSLTPAAVPEPSTFLLLGLGLLGIIGFARRKP